MDHSVDRVLDLAGTPAPDARDWDGQRKGNNDASQGSGSHSRASWARSASRPSGSCWAPRRSRCPASASTKFIAALKTPAECDAAALPFENTLHGSVHENYDLLLKYDFDITAETNVRVVLQSDRAAGSCLRQVRKVYSQAGGAQSVPGLLRQPPRISSASRFTTRRAA